ncbi:adenine phosphoribosyltransferase [Sunxiuqinia elliptica]|uniref:Adenine phosphoribosyltransferase n=1 Tax=Sunxiuqinia elliptica TaxID=655355 RepID=A0A4R6H011_9BACT|nr:adenine phosphoribosyltransferase [Sunxiuqinia elliptica]TDO01270.1 adenine phosphoribosyltransferase [Sunxiuqinia elliptica]TDO57781.1 adenine phosphoribosyltransferase [Sunxiuqinia elliptica]
MNLKETIREIPDYPEKGISFKDITTMLKDPEAFKEVVNQVHENFRDKGITKIVSLESRGFIVGGAVAYLLDAGFVPVRKKGKLPAETVTESYELEYGSDQIEMHLDALNEDDVVLIHDDLLATGGTALAALNLVEKMNVKKVYFSFICDLKFISNGKKDQLSKYETHTLVEY